MAERIPNQLDKKVGDHLRLIGYETAISENELKLSLYWQSPTYTDEDYQIRIKLIQDGAAHLEWSTYPTNARYPTRIWERWETIRDDHWLPLFDLSPGTYEVQVELFGAHRTILIDGDTTLTLETITIPATLTPYPQLALPINVDGRPIVEGVTLWRADDYQRLDLPEYRPRMAIPFVWMGEVGPEERVEFLLINSKEQVYPALESFCPFQVFCCGVGLANRRLPTAG